MSESKNDADTKVVSHSSSGDGKDINSPRDRVVERLEEDDMQFDNSAVTSSAADYKFSGTDYKLEMEAPSAKSVAIGGGYEQTYIVLKSDDNSRQESKGSEGSTNEVLFRCGNWCYRGMVQFNGLKMETQDIPTIIPTLQKQQGTLRYYCNSNNVPKASQYAEPLEFFKETREFCASEVISESVDKELKKWASVFPWIDDNTAQTYFELILDRPDAMDKIALIASKNYYRGLIIISLFCEGNFYFILQPGEGDQALLDIRFPDVSKHGQGLHISTYTDKTSLYRKITLWHVLEGGDRQSKIETLKLRTSNLSSTEYEQTYCVMKSSWDSSSPVLSIHRDVFFRFGSWCYVGRVQLTPSLSLSDIPFLIPALRMQQSRLDYMCEVSAMPTNSEFTPVLQYIKSITPSIEALIVSSEDSLRALIDRLSKMGLADSVQNWLEGDSSNSFFEFKCTPTPEVEHIFKNIDLVVSKCYHASGIITIMIVFNHTFYVTVLEGNSENPLLDSRFPDISGKGRGYQIQSYAEGVEGWSTLRKVSLWQTVGALEQEFKDRVSRLAQAKRDLEGQEIKGDGKENDNASAAPSSSGNLRVDPTLSYSTVASTDGSNGGDGESIRNRDDGVSLDSDGLQSKHLDSLPSSPDRKPGPDSESVSPGGGTMSPLTRQHSLNVKNAFENADSKEDVQYRDDNGEDAANEDVKSVGNDMNGLLISGDGDSKNVALLSPKQKPLSINVARPHHLPKMTVPDSLSSKMEEIRKNMVISGGLDADSAPWDAAGKPKMKKKKKKDKEKKEGGVEDVDAANTITTTSSEIESK